MKKATFLAIILAVSINVFSQDREFQTVFDNQDLRISGLGGPFMQFTSVAGEFAFMMGGGGAVLLDDFFIGGYGLGLTNSIPDYVNQNSDDRLSLGHGGFWLGYALHGEKPFHYPYIRDKIFVLAPTIEAELNLTRYFRIGLGATYNLYTMVDENMHGYTGTDISSPGGFLSFKFGWF